MSKNQHYFKLKVNASVLLPDYNILITKYLIMGFVSTLKKALLMLAMIINTTRKVYIVL